MFTCTARQKHHRLIRLQNIPKITGFVGICSTLEEGQAKSDCRSFVWTAYMVCLTTLLPPNVPNALTTVDRISRTTV